MNIDRTYRAAWIAALLALPIAGGCASKDDGKLESHDDARTLGSVNLALTGGDGIVINRVDYTVTNAAGVEVLKNHVDLSDPLATFLVRLTLPAGTGYKIAMSAETTLGKACAGEATFNVVAGQTQMVSVDLLCDGENDGNNTGDVLVNGTIGQRPNPNCPDVAYVSASPLSTNVGGAVALNAAATSTAATVSAGWTASVGTIAAANLPNTSYTCTTAGAAVLTFTVSEGANCRDTATVQVSCVGGTTPPVDAGQPTNDAGSAPPDATATPDSGAVADAGVTPSSCPQIVSTCHEVDPGQGPIHDCHEIGHDGDAAACATALDSCIALCSAAPTLDAGTTTPDAGPAPVDAGTTTPDAGPVGPTEVSIRFKAEVLGEEFACGRTYTGIGTTPATEVTPTDLRFFVQKLRLINAAGQEVPVTVATRTPWQEASVSLIDFEDGQGDCGFGNAGTNNVITGTVPAGTYTGVAFSTSLPPELNHGDPATAPAPLRNAPGTLWAWLSGYKFLLAEMMRVNSAGELG
ncbi:MAG: hypothetical protein RLZZ450_5202, partial [Pseudomonadota bacterium]